MSKIQNSKVKPQNAPRTMAIILGIDPGTKVMGWGVVRDGAGADNTEVVGYGVFKVNPKLTLSERLKTIFAGLEKVIKSYHPDEMAVEEPFIAENPRTALMVGRAQGIALLAAGRHNIPAFQYTPSLIRQRVTSFGGSDKTQVQEAIKMQLNLAVIPEPPDASDALAVALCHLQESNMRRRLSSS